MAYSDYGGYGYRNGVRVEERSDCTITPEGDTFGTPGSWPGVAMMAAGMERIEVEKRLEWPSGHVVLGDGPIYVVMYKQTTTLLYRGNERLEILDYAVDPIVSEWTDDKGGVHRYIDTDEYVSKEAPLIVEIDGCKLSVFYIEDDNYYQYAELVMPSGDKWHGFSGYGVGAGLEDAGYGFSTEDQVENLWRHFPQ